MPAAGYDLRNADIAFIWRVGLGQDNPKEIEDWTLQMALKLDNKASDPLKVLTDFQSMTTKIRLRIEGAARAFSRQSS